MARGNRARERSVPRPGTGPVRPAAGAQTHIGRQPVHTADGALYGYELLFRPSAAASVSGVGLSDGDAATTSTILAAFSEFGLEELLGGKHGFINLTTPFLTGKLPVPFGPQNAVLEILESVPVTDALLAGVGRLISRGYVMALDDFVWAESYRPLLEVVDLVKLDVLEQSWDEVRTAADRCRPFGVRLLAERVETAEMLERCKNEGFELFQGYYLGRPQTLSVDSLTPAHALTLQLVAQLGEPETTAADVENLLRLDAALTYRLLRIANSASNGLTRRISSLKDAVVILGLAKLRAWLVLIALSDVKGTAEGLVDALAMARTCELLARTTGRVPPEIAFTLGMMQGIASTLGIAGQDLVDRFPRLNEDLEEALRGGSGPLRDVLDAALGRKENDQASAAVLGLSPGDVGHAYLSALVWAHRTMSAAQE
ncbi:MAG: hypothetical protein QG608_95 [Actinomycetota bacterium]|nr:hypothetical protein [Actinomycetota bacterium]